MTTKTAPNKLALIRRYHAIASKLKMTDDQRTLFLQQWGCVSSKDMTIPQLIEACKALSGYKANSAPDTWRKRVMASIFGWFKLIGKEVNVDYVKATAARAAGYDKFNDIPADKLRSVYNAFVHKSRVFTTTGEIMSDELEKLKNLN